MGIFNRRHKAATRRLTRKLFLERLEDRTVPSAVTWTGADGNSQWDDGGNWTTGVAPRPTDDVTISTGTVTLSHDATVESLFLLGGTLQTCGKLSVTSAFTGASNSTLTGSGEIDSLGSGFLRSLEVDCSLVNYGQLVSWDGAVNLGMGGSLTNAATGTFEIQELSTISGAGTLTNAGSLMTGLSGNNDSGPSVISAPIQSSGTITVPTNELDLFGGGSVTGTLATSANTLLQCYGNYAFTLADASSIIGQISFLNGMDTVAGYYTVSGTTRADNAHVSFAGSTVNLTGSNLIVQDASTFDLSVATLAASGDATLSGLTVFGNSPQAPSFLTAPWSLTVNGTLVLQSAQVTAKSGPLTLSAEGGGAIGGETTLDGYTLSNAANQTLNLTGQLDLLDGARLENDGTLNASGSLGVTVSVSGDAAAGLDSYGTINTIDQNDPTFFGGVEVQVPLQNWGTVEVESGQLDLLDGGTNSGTLTGDSGTRLRLGGNFTLAPTSSVDADQFVSLSGSVLNLQVQGASPGSGYGPIQETGSATLEGQLQVTLLNGFVPAPSTKFTIINNEGTSPISGTFVGLPEGSTLTAGATQFQITYLGNGKNDVVLSVAGKADQTITFGPLGSQTYGVAPFALSASASSGLAVSFAIVSGPATINGNTLTVTGAGLVTVEASQAGNGSFNAASAVDQSFSVTPAPLTVLADPQSKVYGQTDPVFTYQTSGFQYSDTAATVLTGALSRVAGENVGGYAITQGTLTANGNYTIHFTGNTLTIVPDTTNTTLTSSLSNVIPGQSLTLSATVSASAPGSGTPTGSVDFFDLTTNTDLGSVPLTGGQAVLSTALSDLGTHVIQATYSGDENFLVSSGFSFATVVQSIDILNATASGALSLSGNAAIDISGTISVDSQSASAVTDSGNSDLTATALDVVGGIHDSGRATLDAVLLTGAATVANPLAGLTGPTGGTFQGVVNLTSRARTINPGIYTNISVSGNGQLTLNPGVYIITGGGLSVSGNASVSGNGVLIYTTGSGNNYGAISLSGNAQVNLTAATSGIYAAIVLFQSSANTSAITVSGNAVLGLAGETLYAASASVNISGNGLIDASLVVNKLQLSGNADVD